MGDEVSKQGEKMNAIPTKYRGRNYRSRLEARWAAFFDMVGWTYEYEPIDFNGWIPDFAIIGKEVLFVEVKPVFHCAESVFVKAARAIKGTNYQCNEVLLLGCTVFNWMDCVSIGWLGENLLSLPDYDLEEEGHFFSINNAICTREKSSIGLSHCSGSYVDRISGRYTGSLIGADSWMISEHWQKSGNPTQWKPVLENRLPPFPGR